MAWKIDFVPRLEWYNPCMAPKLTDELSAAIDASESRSLEVIHPSTNRTYFIVDGDTHRRAMDALQQKRRQENIDAIAEGITQMEAGEGQPLDEAFDEIRSNLQLRPRQS